VNCPGFTVNPGRFTADLSYPDSRIISPRNWTRMCPAGNTQGPTKTDLGAPLEAEITMVFATPIRLRDARRAPSSKFELLADLDDVGLKRRSWSTIARRSRPWI
jgi:hypothetical protein